MAIEKCLKWTLGLAGLFCCAVAFYIVFFLPKIFVDDSGTQPRNAVERFLRKERAAGNGDCIWILLAGESVKTLTSPNYPDFYPSNAFCTWLLTTLLPNDTISIKINTLNIEPEEKCRLDYLQVFLGPNESVPSIGPFCGSLHSRIIDTNSSTLLLKFRSDSMYEDKGFLIDYYIPTEKGCRELLTENSDTLTSPGYPDYYPDDTDCSTLIFVGADKKIILNFDFVDLEYGENCTFDYIQIFDGKDQNSPLLGQICGQMEITTFESSSNHLLLHFHSDSSIHKKGYRARYTSVDERSEFFGNCHWEKSNNNGTITSPNYPKNYPSFANCSMWIQAPDPATRILIVLENIHLEIDANCSYDFLQISEGSPSDRKLLGRYCGRGTESKSLLSNSHSVNIKFQSDAFVEFKGFQLHYEFIKEASEKEDIEEEVSNESYGFIVKPENATLRARSSHMLHCDTDLPNARIRWLKGDLLLAGDTLLPGLKLLTNNTLWVKSMQRHMVGQYTCVIVSPEEDDITTTAYLEMTNGPDDCGIEFVNTPSDLEVKEGDFAFLECQTNVPEVQVWWEKDGRLFKSQKHITVLKNGFLFTEQVRLEDAGLYTCVAHHVTSGCTQKISASLKVNEATKLEDICGKSAFGEQQKPQSDHGKIVGGHDAQKGAYPWQVMLWESERKSFCGASLLNERWILTAAHCVVNNIRWDRIVLKLGKHDTELNEEHEIHTSIADSSAIIYHPDFEPNTYDNDLALVRLRHRVYFTEYIRPICLPDQNLSEELLNGKDSQGPRMGTVVGWGKLKQKGLSPRFLQEIKLPIVDSETCRKSTNYLVTRNMFCAGYSQEVIGDSCQGDSGGPFMMKHEGRWYLLGIVSWGEGCGKMNKYGFYTRIINYMSWIEGIIKS